MKQVSSTKAVVAVTNSMCSISILVLNTEGIHHIYPHLYPRS